MKTRERKNLKKDSFQNLLDGTKIWAEYWRKNPHRFAIEYLGINLYPFQMILIFMMNISNLFAFIACRGLRQIVFNQRVLLRQSDIVSR